MTQAEVSPENSQFSVDVRALHPPPLPLLLRCFEPLSPSRDSAPPVPMQPRSFPAVPSRAHPCHHFPLIKRLCLCERRLIWGPCWWLLVVIFTSLWYSNNTAETRSASVWPFCHFFLQESFDFCCETHKRIPQIWGLVRGFTCMTQIRALSVWYMYLMSSMLTPDFLISL